jgi:hypothetical protein
VRPLLPGTGRLGAAFAGGAVLLMLSAAPALADPAEPTNYESTIVGTDPEIDGAAIEVDGGDAFLVLTVEIGHTAAVPGYSDEPYIRFDADGTVWVNLDSPTFYINEERYARVEVPATADAAAAPRWDRVGSNGTYAWHDHRTHWMSFDRPPGVGGSGRQEVFPWSIPIEVDGTEVSVMGRLDWLPSANPALPAVLGLAALVPLAAMGRRRRVAAAVVAVFGIVGVVLEIAEAWGTPAAARTLSPFLVFPALAAIAGLVVWFAPRTRASAWGLLTGSVLLAAWAAASLDVLSRPVLISAVPAGAERILVAAVGWAGLAGLAVWAVDFRRSLALGGRNPRAEG